LVDQGVLKKVGRPPLVFYVLTEGEKRIDVSFPQKTQEVIDQNYLYITPTGQLLYGVEGFARWVQTIKEEKKTTQLAEEYVKTHKQARLHFTSKGWIDATDKLNSTFEKVFVDHLLYEDFYSLPKFGKTKLGQLVLYAKQSQQLSLIREVCSLVEPLIKTIIEDYKTEAIAFIPPTIPRKIQLINELRSNLDIGLPEINLVKSYSGEVIVAQKTLAKLDERVTNAKHTIYLKDSNFSFQNILLIDDAVGSGATFNETAKKLKRETTNTKITGLALVGSYKGFEIIREV
jgi:hypothetical protein